MKKNLIIIIVLGCLMFANNVYSKPKYTKYEYFTVYVDEDTCIEYFVSDWTYSRGIISPRYNVDGSLKTNKKCLKNK